MTACTNNGGSRARRAVTAALVGVLSVGAAPMVALATNAAPVSGDVVAMATVNPVQNFNNGKVTIARGVNNAAIDLENAEFEKGNAGNKVEAVQVQLGDGTYITSNFSVTGYSQWNDANDNGKVDAGELGASSGVNEFPATKGDYVAVVSGSGIYNTGTLYVPFKVVNKSLQGAYVFDGTAKNADNTLDTSDTTVTYSGNSKAFGGELGLAIDGDVVSPSNFSAAAYASDGVTQVTVNAAGNYTLVVTGKNDYAGSVVKIPMTVEKFDLATAVVELTTGSATMGDGSTPIIPGIAGVEGLSTIGDLALSIENGPAMETGSYTYTVKLKDGLTDAQKANYTDTTGEATLDVVENKVDASDFLYDGKIFNDTNVSTTIDYSQEKPHEFDVTELSVSNDDVESEWLVVEVVNTKTHETGDATMLQTPGQYDVTVKIDPSKCDYKFGGSSNTVHFTVKNGDIKNASVYVSYKGETDSSFTENYTGEDFIDDITVQVKDANGNAVPSDQYRVVVTKGGDVVDSIVDHGTYTIAVESDTYAVEAGTEATFTVSPVNALIIRNTGNFTGQDFLAYTGDVLTPGYEFLVSNDDGTLGNTDDVWATLPTDVYTVTYEQDGKQVELKEVGSYDAELVISDAKGNFLPTVLTTVVKVANRTVFADVPASAWYAEAVYTANEEGYIGGIGGTNLFAPMNDLTRADFACVLYRMAGGEITASQEDLTDENVETISRFTDVDPNAYYAKAVAWATEMGITNGYGDTFGSARTISTEEFVTMLARYAEKTGVDTTVDTDEVLAGVADGDEVSSYARDAVAWAVESGYIAKNGNLIDPQGSIYRARAVQIVVDFQPEQLDGDLIENPNLNPEE